MTQDFDKTQPARENRPAKTRRRALLIDLGIVSALVLLGVILRVYWGADDHGIYHPDEIYQTLEPAHEMVYGFGLHAWEWDIGARNQLLALGLAAVMGVARFFGVEHPTAYLMLTRGLVALLFSSSAYAVYGLARYFKASRPIAVAGAALFLFNPVTIYLGYRALSEVISTPFVLFGLLGALRFAPPATPLSITAAQPARLARLGFIFGLSLLGISVLFRLQNAIFVIALLLPWRFQKERSLSYQLGLQVLVVWALIYGLIDWLTWGLPYQSAGAYVRFNLLMDGTTDYYGADSFFYYPQFFALAMGLAGVLLLVLPLFAAKRARALFWCAAGFLLLHSFFPHKELRFVITTLPMLAALSAVGLQQLIERFSPASRRRLLNGLASAGLMAAASWGVWQVPDLSFGKLGQTEALQVSPQTGAFNYFGDVNRLLLIAADHEDLCALFLPEQWAADAGGHTYFHRDAPFFHQGNPPSVAEAYNYAIATRPPSAGGEPVKTLGEYTLYRTGEHACAPEPDYKPVIYQPVDDEEELGDEFDK